MLLLIQLFVAISVFLVVYLLSRDRGQVEPRSMLWAAFGFGVLAIPIAVSLELLAGVGSMEELHGVGISRLVALSLWIGLVEEIAKFLPLALFIYKKGYFNEHTDGVLYFTVAGMGFGLPENILYTLGEGAGTGLARLVLTPIFHAATTACVGYYLARAKVEGRSLWGPGLALVAMIVVHGFYDFGLLSGVGLFAIASVMTTASISGALFVYATHAKKDDELLGLSAVGINKFCRSCGKANPKQRLYCTACGNHA